MNVAAANRSRVLRLGAKYVSILVGILCVYVYVSIHVSICAHARNTLCYPHWLEAPYMWGSFDGGMNEAGQFYVWMDVCDAIQKGIRICAPRGGGGRVVNMV